MAIHIIKTDTELLDLIPILMQQPVWGFDTETTGLDAHKDQVTLIQIGNTQNQYVIEARKVNIEPLRPFFENTNIRKVGHNLKFDYKMMKGSFGIDVECMKDTMLADKIYHNGRKLKGFGLDDVLKGWLNIDVDKSLQKSFIGHKGDYSMEQLEYAALDVAHLLPLVIKQANHLHKDGLLPTWQMENDVSACFGDMEFYGVMIDKVGWLALINKNMAEAERVKKEMDPTAADFFPATLFKDVDINYASPAQVLQLLQHMRIKVDGELIKDTSDRTLQKLKEYPIVKLIKQYRSYMMRVTHFGLAFLDAIHPATGRIHPEFDQLGTETGRPTSHSKSPVNMLNIPREKEMRNCFIAKDGCVIGTDDYSGCELRIWAYLSQDPFLMDAFNRGLDVHCHVASKLYGVPVSKSNENAHLRTPVKKLNFGIAYGMGPRKLFDDLNGDGYPISFEDTKKLFRNYERDMKTGVTFLRQWGETASQQGYLVNLAGRRRYWLLPNAQDREKYPMGAEDGSYQNRLSGIRREGGNMLIQSVNAEMTKRAMIGLRRYKKERQIHLEILNNVYDELVTECKAEDADEVAIVKKQIMVDAAHQFLKQEERIDGLTGKMRIYNAVPMEVEGHVLPYWTK